jgi:glucosamine-6-phosphate deaminase
MDVMICSTKQECGERAAAHGTAILRQAVRRQGEANIIVATGASQFEMLDALVAAQDIDWTLVTGFHLDEYIDVPISHPASFRKYLKERFVDRLPARLAAFHYVSGEADPRAECRRLGQLIAHHPINVAFVGIGENGHLAFNDPPADFHIDDPYIVVHLDEACRRQQLGEGWFHTLDEVPTRAISMSIRQIMKSKAIVCTVPDARKARAVRDALEGPVTPQVPASILQRHERAAIFLDPPAAALLQHQR